MIENILVSPGQIVIEWYRWAVAVAFAITLVTTLWIFFDSASKYHEATIWRVVSLLASMLVIPSAILSFYPVLAVGLGQLPIFLAYLGIGATILSIFALVMYIAGAGVRDLNPVEEDLEYDILPSPEDTSLSESPTPVGKLIKDLPETHALQEDTDLPSLPSFDLEEQTPAKEPEPLPPLAWIVLMNGHRAGQEFRLRELIDIGRDSKHNDVSIDDPTTSRQHARIRLEQDKFVLYDLASANGISVNGDFVQRQELNQGDRFRIGQSEFAFMHVNEDTDEGVESQEVEEPVAIESKPDSAPPDLQQ